MKKLTAIALVAVSAEYALARRMGRRWGATDEEVYSPLPGDDLVPHPMLESTHAITIAAPPEDVWPWLVQMGYDRGGWYADSWWDPDVALLEFFRVASPEVRARSHRPKTADHILPEFQNLRAGDIIRDGPAGTAYFTVDLLEPNHILGLRSTTHLSYVLPDALKRRFPRLHTGGEFSWVFIVNEATPGASRLIQRARGTLHPAAFRTLGGAAFWPMESILAPRMLRSIKRHVEGAARHNENSASPIPAETVAAAGV